MEVPTVVLQGFVSRLEEQWREEEMEQELDREHSVVRKTSYELVPEHIGGHPSSRVRLLE